MTEVMSMEEKRTDGANKALDEPVVLPTVSAEELLREKGITREEWNNMLAEKVKGIEERDDLTDEEKRQRIASILLTTITKNNRFLFEELLG